ncbi:MAG: hypothetical protein RR490_10770, partial [Niameybacter sp.]
GNIKVTDGQTPVRTYTKSTNAMANETTYDIPAEDIVKLSVNGEPSYTIKISARNPKNPSLEVSALGYIIVMSPPATIKLERPKSYAILDSEKNYTVNWQGENIDDKNGCDVEVKVVKNGTELKVDEKNTTGEITIPLGKVSELKDVYTITAKVKNNGDEAYSYDSYVLTVYNSTALKIWVEKEEKNQIKLENESWVKTKTSEELVALARKIDLTTNISINNGDYNYGTISDQIVWDSENSRIASVNYSRVGRTKNITDYDYTSYSPDTNFVLSGLSDGTTTINATHKQAQMKATLGVEVERLDDKLFLFQIMPKTKTSVTYTNGDGVEKTIDSDSKGAFAIYEASGIKS